MLIDTRGEICPYPMLAAKKAMEQEEEEIVILTDHPPALEVIPLEARRRGFECCVEKQAVCQWRLVLHKSRPEKGASSG